MASKPKRSRGGVMAGIDEIVEQQLRQYLDERGWRYRWQKAVGAKVPEATILDDADNPIAVIEATWLPDLKPGSKKPSVVDFLEEAQRRFEQGEYIHAGGGTVYRSYSLRERLKAKQSQAHVASSQGLPFLLAMYGLELAYCGRDVYELLRDFPEFSALGMLHKDWAISVARRLHERTTLPDETRHLLTIVRDALQERCGYQLGHAEKDFEAFLAEEERVAEVDFPVLCMELLLNPHATYAWPLMGVYDTVYEWDAQTEQFTVAYEGQFAIVRRLAVRLLAGSVSVPWQEAISTSRSEDFYEERDPAAYSA